MGSCEFKQNYSEGHVDLDTQPSPWDLLQRTQPNLYFITKQKLDFGRKGTNQLNDSKTIDKSPDTQHVSTETQDGQKTCLQNQQMNESVLCTKDGVYISPSKCSAGSIKSSLKECSYGSKSARSLRGSSQNSQIQKSVRFNIDPRQKNQTKHSRSHQNRLIKTYRQV